MSVDLRHLAAAAQPMQSMTAQMEAMKMQQTFATLQMCQNLVLSQYLYTDELDGNADAKALRAKAKSLLQAYLDGQEITQD